MKSITEEMRFRQRLCEYALKYGVTRAARRYHTNRQFVYRQLKKYDGDVRSLALKSRQTHKSPNAHNEEELGLVRRMLSCKQIRKRGYIKPKIRRKSYTKYERMDGRYPGDKVQVDIKYVPEECVRFPSYGDRYYQITAIDEYSRKRVLKIVKEKSTYETSKYLLELEKNMGFKINTIQVDNGYEFVNDAEKTNRKTRFQLVAEYLGMKIKRTRPYSPWQNGKVERSHREDGKILYGRKIFRSEKELKTAVKKHMQRYNSTAKISLNFKSPNEIVSEYFSKCNICLDN